jgi:hypothetical protein
MYAWLMIEDACLLRSNFVHPEQRLPKEQGKQMEPNYEGEHIA